MTNASPIRTHPPAAGWRASRLLPLVAAAIAAVPALVLDGTALARSVGVVAAITFGAVVALWQRLATVLGRQRDQSHVLGSLRQDVGHPTQAALGRGEPRSLREHLSRLEESTDALLHELARAERDRRTDDRHAFAQIEASLNLFAQLPPQARMPGLRGWAMSPDLLLVVVEILRQRRPRLVLELGGGSSTIWLAHAIRLLGLDTRLVTLEHDEKWVRTIEARLDAHGLQDVVGIRLAPLVEQPVAGETYRWYDPSAWQDLTDVDLLLVDGPPAATGEQARYPAGPLLVDRLAANAIVVLDDAIRDDEQRMAKRWAPLLSDFARLNLPVEKKAIVFYRGQTVAL